jgi:hypothetical protein
VGTGLACEGTHFGSSNLPFKTGYGGSGLPQNKNNIKKQKKTKKLRQKQTQKHHRPSLQASPPRSVRLIFTGAVYPFCISDSSAYTRAQFVTPPSRSDPARFVSDRVTVLAARPAATSDRRREPLRHRVTDRVMSPEGLSQIISRHQHPPPKNIETSRLPPRTAT